MVNHLKILVCGDVEGDLDQLYNRVTRTEKKAGKFDILFCVGNFFGKDDSQWKKYSTGENIAPINTLILGPNQSENCKNYEDHKEGGELCHNITYLGKKGIYTSSSGLKMAYLSGIESNDGDWQFSRRDVDSLRMPYLSNSQFKGVDVLLTSQWPKGVEKYASTLSDDLSSDKFGSSLISQLSISLKPRYHFCAFEGIHYERQPYRNHKILQENAQHVSRFIALARVGNVYKKKYLYAFNITPLSQVEYASLIEQPSDVTECPYTIDHRDTEPKQTDKSAQFFYDQDMLDRNSTEKKRKSDNQNGHAAKKSSQPASPCWFCLGSPQVEKHLVISVGTHTYLALAKGGLTDDHVLILPIGHHQSTVAAPEEVTEEIQKYKKALKKCFKKQGKVIVFFERNFKTQHLQIQVIPIQAGLIAEVKETFSVCAHNNEIELDEIPKLSELKQIFEENMPYFYAELPTGEKLMFRIKKGGFPLQFGRDVLAHDTLLDLPHRVDWRNCKSSKEEETQMTQSFRQLFSDYDFNS